MRWPDFNNELTETERFYTVETLMQLLGESMLKETAAFHVLCGLLASVWHVVITQQ